MTQPTIDSEVDKIIFRCFAQGQYWGTEQDGKLDPDYKPENPIDRTEAVAAITNLIAQEANKAVQAREQQLISELLGELPRSYKDKVGLDVAQLWDSADATDGYNQALQDVVSVIERFLQGEQLDSLNDGTESRPPDQNKTNDGGSDGGL